jgi:hypothetical protein
LRDLEAYDHALAAVRPLRTLGEFCWTATPSICLHSLDRGGPLESVTYLDADLQFFTDPGILLAERPEASILLTPHRYSDDFYASQDPAEHPELGGVYNVQFLHFREDVNGRAALSWWRDRCLEWCHDRIEPGRYGDQKYLDDWPQRFSGVHVLEHVGGGLAPWNAARFEIRAHESGLLVDSMPLVFHHFQSLRLHAATPLGWASAHRWATHGVSGGLPWSVVWNLSPVERELLWEPYVERVLACMGALEPLGFSRDFWLQEDFKAAARLRTAAHRLLGWPASRRR